MNAKKQQPIPSGMERPAGGPTSAPPPSAEGSHAIRLTIFRNGHGPVYLCGFSTIQQAVEAGQGWPHRLWWRVEKDGVIVAEKPKAVKK